MPNPPPRPPRRWPRVLRGIAEAFVVLMALGALGLWCSVPNTAPLAGGNPASTAFIDLRRDEAAAAGKPWKLQWTWRPIGRISRYLREGVVFAEDYNFYRHDGVDWTAVEHAVQADWNKGSLGVGGSTITQQLAKNLYLSPKRSVFRKAREMLIAFSLEDHLTKQRILELYLNCVEWGDGVFGAEAAAQHWFGHSAQSLSPAEAARLAIALPNPILRAPNVRTAELTRKAVRIVRLYRMNGLIDSAQERAALDELGAGGEKVLPDREVQRAKAAAPPADEPPVAEPAPAEPAPAPAEPVTHPDEAGSDEAGRD